MVEWGAKVLSNCAEKSKLLYFKRASPLSERVFFEVVPTSSSYVLYCVISVHTNTYNTEELSRVFSILRGEDEAYTRNERIHPSICLLKFHLNLFYAQLLILLDS